MRKAISAITFFDVVFLLMLSVTGNIGGTIGNIIYYLAFIVPLFFASVFLRNNKDDEVKPEPPRLLPDLKSLGFALPLVFPFIAAVFLVSFLTSLLLNALGFSSVTDVSGNIFGVIVKHALIPSLFEEAVFRFIPIMLLSPYSKKNALFISSVMFASVHCNLFQIPYALTASLVLSAVAIATGSIFPSVMLHFLNNLASISFMRCAGVPYFNLIFFLSLGVLTLLSLGFIYLKRDKYMKALKDIYADKCRVEFTPPVVLFVTMALVIGVVNLCVSL